MFLRFVAQSIRRAPRRKAMAIGAVALGSAVATAMLGAMLDVGDRVNRELRSLGANLLVIPKSASLPVDIGGIRYQPAAKDEFIPEAAVPKIKSIFWTLNITALAPSLHAQTKIDGRDIPVGEISTANATSGRILTGAVSAWPRPACGERSRADP